MVCLNDLKRPLDLYGIIRENEKLIHILSIGKNIFGLQYIGRISKKRDLGNKNHNLIGIVDRQLKFFYRQKSEWQKVKHYTIDLQDSMKRTPFDPHLMKLLAKAVIVVFGIGTGGARIATGLARSGITMFRLIDPDTFNIHNISRHECDLGDLGRFKVNAIKERILRINPMANVDTYAYDVFTHRNRLDRVFHGANLVIAATDRKSAQLKINNECYRRKIPVLFGGCYEEARGGEVLYVIPGKTSVCYECLVGAFQQAEKTGKIDYSNATNQEDYEGEPGLNAAINYITDIAQQYAIALLLRNEDCAVAKLVDPQRNLLLIGGALGAGYYLFKKPFHFIRPRLTGPWKDCGTCQTRDGGIKVQDVLKKHQIEVI